MARPSTVEAAAWDAIFANYSKDVGVTMGEFQVALDNAATYLSQQGVYTHDADRLQKFLINVAYGYGAISHNYHVGLLGRGRPSPIGSVATTDADGDVTVKSGDALYAFTKLSNGTYAAAPGDPRVLTKVGNHYELRRPDGAVLVFLPDGKWNYTESRAGNRTTAGYTGNQLTSITDYTVEVMSHWPSPAISVTFLPVSFTTFIGSPQSVSILAHAPV